MGELARVEHGPAPLLVFGTVIVPVALLGTALTVGDAPGAKPLVPTGALGSVPSEEVTPSGGMAVPTWAKAWLLHNRGHAVTTTINDGLIGNPLLNGQVSAGGDFHSHDR
jgi:hypothetical protein